MSSKSVTDIYKQTKRNRPVVKVEARPTTEVQPKSPSSKTDEELLRDFDLTLEYGPCIGISRLERWERAQKHGLNPPSHVKDLILKHSDNITYEQSLWSDYSI